jgi:hypothetical protein
MKALKFKYVLLLGAFIILATSCSNDLGRNSNFEEDTKVAIIRHKYDISNNRDDIAYLKEDLMERIKENRSLYDGMKNIIIEESGRIDKLESKTSSDK